MATRTFTATTRSRSAARLATSRDYTICDEYRPDMYAVNSVDGLAAVGSATELMHYTDSRLAAAVGYRDECGASVVMGFPFEAITDAGGRDVLMKDILKYLLNR